jgi:hypothetical protein
MNTNQMKMEMLERIKYTASRAELQVTALMGLDRVGDTGDFDLQDQLTLLHEAVLKLRDCANRSMRIVDRLEIEFDADEPQMFSDSD